MSNHYDPEDEPYKSLNQGNKPMNEKDKIAGDLVALRFDIEDFTTRVRRTAVPFSREDINMMQTSLKDFASRVSKISEAIMDIAPAHEHLKHE